MSFIAFAAGLLADVVSRNRQLLEITLEKIRRIELAQGEQDDGIGRMRDADGDDEPVSLRAKG